MVDRARLPNRLEFKLEHAYSVRTRGFGLNTKGITVHRRAILLFILFVSLAVFYAYGVNQVVPDIKTKQQAQLEQLSTLDEQARKGASEQE